MPRHPRIPQTVQAAAFFYPILQKTVEYRLRCFKFTALAVYHEWQSFDRLIRAEYMVEILRGNTALTLEPSRFYCRSPAYPGLPATWRANKPYYCTVRHGVSVDCLRLRVYKSAIGMARSNPLCNLHGTGRRTQSADSGPA